MSKGHLSIEVRQILESAGWTESWNYSDAPLLNPSLNFHEAAQRILREYGDISAGASGPGEYRGCSRISVNPDLCRGMEQNIIAVSQDWQLELYPIGMLDESNVLVLADSVGRIYTFFGDLQLVAPRFLEEALDCILRGTIYVTRSKFPKT